MLTRVRIEARGETNEAVKEELIDSLVVVRETTDCPGSWEITDEEIQTSRDGYWGFIVMKQMLDEN
jgi:hypothetical protein